MIICLFALGFPFGIIGVAIAVNIMVIVGIVQQLWLVRKFVDYSLVNLFFTPLVSLAGGMGLYYLSRSWITVEGSISTGLLKLGAFTIGYGILFLIFEYKTIRDDYYPMILRAFKVQPKGQEQDISHS
jgi:hypothetical protein